MKNAIHIPERLKEFLERQLQWDSCVEALCQSVNELLDRPPIFFREYTEHNMNHVTHVLQKANRLITKESYNEKSNEEDGDGLTPRNIAYLVAAIMIHDLGMFIDAEGFKCMLDGSWKVERVPGSGDEPWIEEWDAYISRAKRYSSEKKVALFGKDISVDWNCFKKPMYDDDDCLVIGDFLREHHPRLAYEIAVAGMPGSEQNHILKHAGFGENSCRVIGFLARSHGMPLREAEQLIKVYFGEDSPKIRNTPVVFLMAVIRIADYLDAGEHRAPIARELILQISAPVSKEEWKWNQCIDNEDCEWAPYHKKRKIYADPQNSFEYTRLEKWLNAVQHELDVSWAMIAEKYSHEPYALSVHRVTSNIYDPKFTDENKRSFLAKEALISANPKILDLLIAPLYGKDPVYGVRELVQNAVDACIEREFYEREHADGDKEYIGHVSVEIDTEEKSFTITDNGIGMNEDVLLNYYLAAGASYRSSDEWLRQYSRDGRVQVARTGKFGVGFLAAFLLGDTVTVSTRHRNDSKGYRFTFEIQSKPLNIECVEYDKYGTSIQIALKEGVLEQLLCTEDSSSNFSEEAFGLDVETVDTAKCWNAWYAYDNPVVTYRIDGRVLSSGDMRISREPQGDKDWFSLETDNFEFYRWRYLPDDHSAKFYCNGLRIYGMPERSLSRHGLAIPYPQIAVSDRNGVLDVDLARSRVQTFPEEERLATEIANWHIARLLMTDWESDAAIADNLTWGFRYSGTPRTVFNPYLLTPKGFLLNRPDICRLASCERYAALFCTGKEFATVVEDAYRFVRTEVPVSIVCSLGDVQHRPGSDMLELFLDSFVPCRQTPGLSRRSYRPLAPPCSNLWIEKGLYEDISQRLAFELPGNVPDGPDAVHAWRLNRRRIPNTGEMPINKSDFSPTRFPVAAEMFCERRIGTGVDAVFIRQLRELLGDQDPWIPYRMVERKKKFPEAFKKLKEYTDRLSGELQSVERSLP